jgi:putative phosphoribosyl transferase
VFVLGIPRGGVVVADTIARKLGTSNFDIVLPRKLLTPYNKENGFGAVMEDESEYIDYKMVDILSIPLEYIIKEKLKKIQEMKSKSLLYRNTENLLQYHIKLNDKNRCVILVDDGAATGSTLICTARWIKNRKEHKFKKLIIAIPVAPKQTVNLLKAEFNHVEVIMRPTTFETVSQFYKSFEQITDNQIIDILKKWK